MFEVTFFLSQNIMVSKKIVVFCKVLSTLNVERQLRAGVSNLGGEGCCAVGELSAPTAHGRCTINTNLRKIM